MRIAISGTHYMGKTTLINDFITSHPNYIFVDEPHNQLAEFDNTNVTEELDFEQAIEQLKYNIEQFNSNLDEENIIFDRCPVDFLAYAMCSLEEEQIDIKETELAELLPEIQEVLSSLDLIGFLPITQDHDIIYTEENPAYRSAADRVFKKIYRDDDSQLFPIYNQPKIIEVVGTPEERMKIIGSYV